MFLINITYQTTNQHFITKPQRPLPHTSARLQRDHQDRYLLSLTNSPSTGQGESLLLIPARVIIQMQWEQAERELNLLKRELQNTKQSKNHQIQELEHALNRANIRINELERLNKQQEQEYKSLKEQFKGLQHFSKERSLALTHKNIQIAALQKQLQDLSIRKAQEQQAAVDKLLQVIRTQQIELNILLGDHQGYLTELQKIAVPFAQLRTECSLLSQYNGQLEKQIKEVQTVNTTLQSWVGQAHQELTQQNEQSNDLLGQVEYIIESVTPIMDPRVF